MYLRKEPAMVRQVRCECGYVARGNTDEAVIELVLVHVAETHPELASTETADDIRDWIELLPD
jgi:predicted small metal-binding protein